MATPVHRKTASTEALLKDFGAQGLARKRVLSADLVALDVEAAGRRPAPPAELDLFINGQQASVRVTEDTLEWVEAPRGCCSCLPVTTHTIKFSEIVSVQKAEPKQSSLSLTSSARQKKYRLNIFTLRRSNRRPTLWRPWYLTLSSRNEDDVSAVLAAIQTGIDTSDRPTNLVVILNPNSGVQGGSKRCYFKDVKPIFEAAGIQQVQVLETQRTYHAFEIIKDIALRSTQNRQEKAIDGIIAVGGDGIFNEVLNGLLSARAAAAAKNDIPAVDRLAKLRLAHVPCGSTDAVAASLHGARDAITAALHVVLGDRTPLDVLRVDSLSTTDKNNNNMSTNNNDDNNNGIGVNIVEPRFACCICTNGFMPTVVELSEQHRWLGPIRYDLLGAYVLLQNQSYTCRVKYLEGPPMGDSEAASSNAACTSGCAICRSASFALQRAPSDATFTLPAASAIDVDRSDEIGQGCGSVKQQWKAIEGEWMSIMLIIQPCRSDKTPHGMARHAHLADGKLKLVLVEKCPAWRYLQFLSTMASSGLIPEQMPHVKVIDAVAVKVEIPEGVVATKWNLDGELLDQRSIAAEVHQGLVDVFARGVEI